MAVAQEANSAHINHNDPSFTKPLLHPHMGIFSENATIVKASQYIGSFMVTGSGHHERAEVVRQKLEAARAFTQCKPILLLISLNGIKVCRDTDKHVYMAHALRRISYATCDPDHLQFAFLAREPKAEPNVQYCHAFVTATSEQAEELNNIIGEAFRVAYAQQQLSILAQRLQCASVDHHPAVSNHSEPSNVWQARRTNGNAHNDTRALLHCSASPLSGQSTDISRPVPNKSSLPPSSLVTSEQALHTGSNSKSEKDALQAHREQRGHRHHKHHKHRHRHKVHDIPTIPQDDTHSTDSGLHTNESTDITEPSDEACSRRSQVPPPPPPRGSSSLETFAVEAFTEQHIDVRQTQSASVHPHTSTDERLSSNGFDNVCLNSIEEEHLDGNVARPPSVASRPQSEHCYDIADQHTREMPCTNAMLDSTGNSTAPSKTTTASSSTTGCSTATSGSGSAGSCPGPVKQNDWLDSRQSSSLEKVPCRFRSTPTRSVLAGQESFANGDSSRRNSRVSARSSYDTLYETEELAHVAWYQPHIPREAVLELLSRQPPGSFIVRDSGTHTNCYALSVRFGEGSGRCATPHKLAFHSHSASFSGEPERRSGMYSAHAGTGISHFLIQRTVNGGVRLKGLDKEWPSLSCLVLHLTVMPEMLPCALRLPKSAANPSFCPTDARSGSEHAAECDPPAARQCPLPVDGHFSTEDQDYQRLSDFSAIMADLKSEPLAIKRSSCIRSGH